jgi:hypothetical protein
VPRVASGPFPVLDDDATETDDVIEDEGAWMKATGATSHRDMAKPGDYPRLLSEVTSTNLHKVLVIDTLRV